MAMCVNDLIVQGAEPLFFLDYFATGRLSVASAAKVVRGIAKGCEHSGCALVGGETAEMPGMYADGHYDLAGFSVGAAERSALLPAGIAAGDTLIALPSSGVHSNGFSLVRRIVADAHLTWTDPAAFAPGRTLGEAFLEPTRLYVRPVLALHKAGLLHGAAHITGGGLPGNLPRVLPDGLDAVIDQAWPMPAVFKWLARTGNVDSAEMLRVFNCGIGMILITPEPDKVLAMLAEAGKKPSASAPLLLHRAPMPSLTLKCRQPRISGQHEHGKNTCCHSAQWPGQQCHGLITAAQDPDFPARICLVLSNNPDAPGLDMARAAGLPTLAIDHRSFGKDRAAHERAIHAALEDSGAQAVCLAGICACSPLT